MKKLNITVVDQQIVNSYRKNRKKIPNNYVSFLKQNKIIVGKYSFNIGDVLEDVCYENNNADDNALNFLTISFFYSVNKDNNNDLLTVNTNTGVGFYKRIPSDFIVVAENYVGDQICLGINGEYYNKVYLWEMENEADSNTPQPYYDNMTLITNTFEEFLEGLFIDV